MDRTEKHKLDSIIQRNEKTANKLVEKTMRMTFYIFCIIYLLNITGIFIIDQKDMNIAFFASTIVLLLPTFTNKLLPEDDPSLKYIYVFLATLFIFIITITITYHAFVVFVYPILIAGIYINNKLTKITSITTIIITSIAQVIGFYQAALTDVNFPTLSELIIFSVVPKALCLLALSSLMSMIARRTDILIKAQIQDSNMRSKMIKDLVISFTDMIETKCVFAPNHLRRSVRYITVLMEAMKESGVYADKLTTDFMSWTRNALPFYDIGMATISDEILQKEGKITADEYDEIKNHPSVGCEMLQKHFSHVGNEGLRYATWAITHCHHEKWNGMGYPERLEGEEIPLAARIATVVDVFEAVSQDRPNRKAMSLNESFKVIEEGSGTDFDPNIVKVFMNIKDTIISIYNEY